MTTNHVKAILTSLRAMVIKMLPAYKFYLGSTTETTTTQIGHGVMSVGDGQTQGQGALTLDDASFAGFVEGETYTVVVNGVSGEYVAKQAGGAVGVTNAAELENPPEDYWAVAFRRGMCVYNVKGSYANATISISQTKTVTTKRYQNKKLDKELLPDSVESGIKAANAKATTALSSAQDAQDTANQAVSDAATAQAAANTAQAAANTALKMYEVTSETTISLGTMKFTDKAILKTDLNIVVGSKIICRSGSYTGVGVWNGNNVQIEVGVFAIQISLDIDGITYQISNVRLNTIAPDVSITYQKTEVPATAQTRTAGTWLPSYLISSCLYLVSINGGGGGAITGKIFRVTVNDSGELSTTEVTNA